MRKVIADLGVKASELVTKPDGMQRRLKLAEPNSANVGPTLFQGTTKYRPRSRQELLVKVSRSGDYDSDDPEYGAQFVVEPDYLKNESDVAVVDELNPIGTEKPDMPHYHECIDGPQTTEVYHPRATALEHWGDKATTGGVLGMSIHILDLGTGSFSVLGYLMYDLDITTSTGYMWEYKSTIQSQIGNQTFTNTPSCDVVELPDGSIVIMLAYDDTLQFWKSYDCGDTWHQASEVTVTSRKWTCAINRIGTRLVACYAYRSAGVSHHCYAITSDDGGVTWSSSNDVYNLLTASPKSNEYIDTALGQNGKLYLVQPGDNAGNPVLYETRDGANWTNDGTLVSMGGTPSDTSVSICQTIDGRWFAYIQVNSGSGDYIQAWFNDNDDPNAGSWSNNNRISIDGDSDGLENDYVCARAFHDSGFIDCFVRQKDTHGTTQYAIVTSRVGMWSGLSLDFQWSQSWAASCYPSTSDSHPNQNVWSQSSTGGTVALTGLSGTTIGYLGLSNGATSSNEIYYSDGLATESYDTGIIARFSLAVPTGSAKVMVTLCSDGSNSNKDVNFYVVFRSSGEVQLVDENGSSVLQTVDPTNWTPADWNEYVLVAKENEVELYRAPVDRYREFAHYELVFSEDSLTEDAYAADNDAIEWGIISTSYADQISSVRWRSFMYYDAVDVGDYLGWDFDADPVGRRCVAERSIGIMQGISCRWGGNYAVEDDEWELDVGAVYEVENIMTPSPSRRWQERDTGGSASSATTITWERETDDNGNDLAYEFDAFAVFGRNWCDADLYTENAGGGGSKNLALGGVGVLAKLYSDEFTISSIDEHKITPTLPTGRQEFIPGMYASDGYRFWYVKFQDGTLADKIYRVVGNDETNLYLEVDVETLGASTDTIRLFSDRFLFTWDSVESNARVKLTIDSVTTSPSEDGLRIGTIVLGRVYDIPDDEWEATVVYEVFTSRFDGRAGRSQVSQIGGRKRIMNLQYTGMTDRGMFRSSVGEFLRVLRDGERPLVWIDDDTERGGQPIYQEPILFRAAGFSQKRAAYGYLQDNFGTASNYIYNILDAGLKFEEVL